MQKKQKNKDIKIKQKPKQLTVIASKTLYEKDFYAWAYKQAKLLENKDYEKLDRVNLIEEIESLGRRDKSSLQNHLQALLQHLLKNTYTPELKGNSRSWDSTIFHVRKSILSLLQDSPSLKSLLPKMLNEAYSTARQMAIIETASSYIREHLFPEECPWSLEEILNDAT